MRKIVAASDVPLADGVGEGKPEITDALVYFNGVGLEGFETFAMSNGKIHGFCKTKKLPYDLVVTAVLTAFRRHFPDASVTSDGSLEEWAPGEALCQEACGWAPR